jgi:hypothetical protein
LRGLDFAIRLQARRVRTAESSSSSYGLVARLTLLSTSPRGDAVTSNYGPENAGPEGTRTLLFVYTCRRTSGVVAAALQIDQIVGMTFPPQTGR